MQVIAAYAKIDGAWCAGLWLPTRQGRWQGACSRVRSKRQARRHAKHLAAGSRSRITYGGMLLGSWKPYEGFASWEGRQLLQKPNMISLAEYLMSG